MTTTAAAEPLIVDVPRYLLVDNDAAHGGRLPLLVECPACGDLVPRQIGMLAPGRWLIDHQHVGRWRATPVTGAPTATAADDVAALAAVLAPSPAGAR